MIETWRWFGPKDTVSLKNIRQAGATGVVTSLHEIPTGEVWPLDSILARKKLIEECGLTWEVVESVPLHNDIKLRQGEFQHLIDNYRDTVRNLGKAGINTICYNFMPVVDWTRTNLSYSLPNQSEALRFEMSDFAAYDVFILKRERAEYDYSGEVLKKAKKRIKQMSNEERQLLEKNIIAGLPGGEGSYTQQDIRIAIEQFIALGNQGMRDNLIAFLRSIVPVAEDANVKLCIHPDDPPFSLFGLPRVVSTAEDARHILNTVQSYSNGLTLCAGSFGARGDNDLISMIKEFGPSIHFIHLRNIKRESDGSFYESEHLDGDNDMVGIIEAILEEQLSRTKQGRIDDLIPMRPDHGHLMGEEMDQNGINPGYSFAGRLKGLAELRGVTQALKQIRSRIT